MRIGVLKETKAAERRVAITPAGTRELVADGHAVFIERGAGGGISVSDDDFRREGASIVDTTTLFGECELILKVKEPNRREVASLGPEHILFCYLHLAADEELATSLAASGATCIAYETVKDRRGGLPLLVPMSEIAGRLAAQAGAVALEAPSGGRGVMLAGAAGVPPAEVVVVGAGVAGQGAAAIAAGLGARVTVLDRDVERLRGIERNSGPRCVTAFSSKLMLEELLRTADLVIGSVLIPGARAPRVMQRADLALMRPGAVLVDISIDQGGCFATSQPTTHAQPTIEVDGILHYGVSNMPAAVPLTSTYALTNATLPYVSRLAAQGVSIFAEDPGCASGINIRDGQIAHPEVVRAVELAGAGADGG